MDTRTAIVLLHCFLFAVLVQSAPVGPGSDPPPAFGEAAERAKVLLEKILKDLPAVHAITVNAEGLTFDPSAHTTNLQMMVRSLGIPASPVIKPLSERFTLDMCVSRMMAGCRLYQELLGVLSKRLSGLQDLRVDLRDLLTHITKMKEVARLGGDSSDQDPDLDLLLSCLHGNYDVQVAVHLTLTQLRSFCHDLIRSLRAISRAAGMH
ncbi:colony stimulating factor 3 (granulocyte) b [Echeneis naucrates]|uniref:Uncharacterized LOC115047736 n=1 Tax=Echeneis naucrates TaxID=173247 RepID=A0A665WRX9_ECHNA|nr:uncharacterized protein LOC115047736 [Echeneis naucrates]